MTSDLDQIAAILPGLTWSHKAPQYVGSDSAGNARAWIGGGFESNDWSGGVPDLGGYYVGDCASPVDVARVLRERLDGTAGVLRAVLGADRGTP